MQQAQSKAGAACSSLPTAAAQAADLSIAPSGIPMHSVHSSAHHRLACGCPGQQGCPPEPQLLTGSAAGHELAASKTGLGRGAAACQQLQHRRRTFPSPQAAYLCTACIAALTTDWPVAARANRGARLSHSCRHVMLLTACYAASHASFRRSPPVRPLGLAAPHHVVCNSPTQESYGARQGYDPLLNHFKVATYHYRCVVKYNTGTTVGWTPSADGRRCMLCLT
jgi:hypothetical protein